MNTTPTYDWACRDSERQQEENNDLSPSGRKNETTSLGSPNVSSTRKENNKHNQVEHPYNGSHHIETHKKEEDEVWKPTDRYSSRTEQQQEIDISRSLVQKAKKAFQEERLRREQSLVDRLQELQKELFSQKQLNESLRCEARSQKEKVGQLERENTVLQKQLHVLRDQLAIVGELCMQRGKVIREAGIPFALVRLGKDPMNVPTGTAGTPKGTSSGPLEEMTPQTDFTNASEQERDEGSSFQEGTIGSEVQRASPSFFSLRSIAMQPAAGSAGTSTPSPVVSSPVPASAARPSFPSTLAPSSETAWCLLPKGLEGSHKSTAFHDSHSFALGQAAAGQLHYLLSNTSGTTPNTNTSIIMANTSLRSDGPSFDYNDLVPVKAEGINPELLAVLHTSFIPPPVAQNATSSPPDTSETALSPPVPMPASGAPPCSMLRQGEEIQWLRHQIEAQRKENARERERHDRVAHRQHVQLVQEREVWSKAVRRLEEINACCIRDLIECQRIYGPKLQKAEEDAASLKNRMATVLESAEAAQRDRHEIALQAEKVIAERFKQRFSELKSQLMAKTEQWEGDRRQLVRLADEQQQKVKALEAELVIFRSKYQKELARFELEKEGAQNELRLMRQSLRKLEKKSLFAKMREVATSADDLAIAKYYIA